METALISLLFCIAPALVIRACGKSTILEKIGPVLLLYIAGVILGNIGINKENLGLAQDIFSNAMVPLAVPLMLYSCTFRKSETRSQMMAMVTGLLAVIITVFAGYFIFGTHIPQGDRIGGLLTGVYTGGTINLAALKAMLDVEESTYILLNSYDMLVSFLYMTFLLSVGYKLFRRILPNETNQPQNDRLPDDPRTRELYDKLQKEQPYKGLFTKNGMTAVLKLTGITLGICALSGGCAIAVPSSAFMTVFILMLTTLGIAASFNRKIRRLPYSYDIGMYLIYIFCIAVASMADLRHLNMAGGINLLGYLLFTVFGSLALQVLMAWIFRIDADTTVIASVTFINSPPFVPMVAAAMNNRKIIVTGLSIGIIGYAIGNYLGFLISQILKSM